MRLAELCPEIDLSLWTSLASAAGAAPARVGAQLAAFRPMTLVMTLKVRDEEDVIEDNLRFHRALGVDFFVVMDNGSVDRTPEILARYEDAGLAHVLRDESGDLRTLGAEWYTRMGRMAATEFGADWVIHNDADEFWWPLTGNLDPGSGRCPGAVRRRRRPARRVRGAAGQAGLVRRAAGGARGALEPAAQGRPPRRSGRRGAPPGGPRRRGGGERRPVAGAAPAGAGGPSQRPRWRRRSLAEATRTSGSSGRQPGRFASSISRCAPSSSSDGGRRSRCATAGFATRAASGACASTTSRVASRSCTPS